MSASASEGGKDDDDILGFPGDGFVNKTDANPGVIGEQEGDDTRMDEAGGASSQDSVMKSSVVLPDGFVTAQTRLVAEASAICNGCRWDVFNVGR
jgi:hypothetical protein